MARSLGNTRGVYSEIESGRHCLTTPSRSLVNKGLDPTGTNPELNTIPSSRVIDEPTLDGSGTASSDQSSVLQDPGREQRDIEIQITKPTTVQTLRGCAGNWLCLLVGIIVLAGSIVMTVFGFIASDFSETMTDVGNTTVTARDEAMYESLTSLKTYGPILTGCACFIIMCACVLLCDARDKLRASAEPEDSKDGPEALTYATVLRRIYEDEIIRKDEEETLRRTQKIDEYFECMSKHPVGRRTLIRAMRPRSLSDPCISCTRSESPLPDVYEYAKERLDIHPIRETGIADGAGTPANSPHETSASRPKSATPVFISDISPPGQILYLERSRQGALPPISSRSKNGPIRVDTSSLPVGSLEKLYLGDDSIISGTHKKQKKKKRGKRKKRETHKETKCEQTSPEMTLHDDDPEKTHVKLKHPISCKLKVTQEAQKSIPHAQPTISTTEEKQGHRHHGEIVACEPETDDAGRGKIDTVPAVTSELEPSIRTLKWVEENNEQPWNKRTLESDRRDEPLYRTTGSKSNIRKSSTGSLSFDGSNALSFSHSAMVL